MIEKYWAVQRDDEEFLDSSFSERDAERKRVSFFFFAVCGYIYIWKGKKKKSVISVLPKVKVVTLYY